MGTAIDSNPHYELLVDSIKKTFKGNGKIFEVLSSLNALFSEFEESLDTGNESTNPSSSTAERKYEREMLLGVVTVLLDHIIKDQNSSIQKETISKFLGILKSGMDQSTVALNIQRDLNNSKVLLQQVHKLFESEGVSDDDIEDISQRIQTFLSSSYSDNNAIIRFQDNAVYSDDNDHIEDLESKLYEGWYKNEYELNKRGKKLDHFRIESAEQLEILEKSITEAKDKNEKFRSTLNETSNRISVLIQQLNDANQQCEFMQKQINIVDTTISEMEKCKQKTDEEYAQLEEQLLEKENSLIQFLKRFDRSMDESLIRHQEILERNDNFNEALEELAQCYSEFEKHENTIVEKYNLSKIQCSAQGEPAKDSTSLLNQKIIFLQQEHQEDLQKIKTLENHNTMLTDDINDLFEMNNKLTNENLFLHAELETMAINRITESKSTDNIKTTTNSNNNNNNNNSNNNTNNINNNNNRRNSSETNNNKYQQIEKLKSENLELNNKIKKLNDLQGKVQAIYAENKELVDENNHLSEDIQTLESQVETLQEECKSKNAEIIKLQPVNDNLVRVIKKINETYQPRVLRMKTTKSTDVIALVKNEGTELEELLQNEHDRNVSLEKSRDHYQNLYATLTGICRKIGLDKLQAMTSYNLSFQSSNGEQTYNYSGFSITENEVESIRTKANSRDTDTIQGEIRKAEEKIVDELSTMLQASYSKCDEYKQSQKQMKERIESLEIELKHQSQVAMQKEEFQNGHPQTDSKNTLIQPLIQLYEEMGIQQLQYGVTYSIHYQALRTKGSGRRPSKVFQHSVAAINFDSIKTSMNQMAPKSTQPSPKIPRRKVSQQHHSNFKVPPPLETTDTSQRNNTIKENDALIDIAFSGKSQSSVGTNVQELERLLRIAKRENKETMDKNRNLRRELNQLKENKERFMDAQKMTANDDEEASTYTRSKMGDTGDMVDPEDFADLDQAYRLSEANCTFLEQQNSQLSSRVNNAESLAHQYRENIFDQQEQMECVSQELIDQRKKNNIKQREITELKKDIEYLENDLDYCRQKLQEAGVSHNQQQLRADAAKKIFQTEESIRSDMEMIITEKNSLILECESLSARIKFLDAEKKFALEEARVLSEQNKRLLQENNEHMKSKECACNSRKNQEVESNVAIEDEVKTKGLAKQFKALQKDLESTRQELKVITEELMRARQSSDMLTIELQALQSTNQELEEKVISLEQNGFERDQMKYITHEVNINMSEEDTESLQGDSFDDSTIDEKISLTQENEEIKQSNKFLIRRNSHLRRESLAASLAKNQLKLLQEKVHDLENENVILKLESMKGYNRGGRRRSGSRRLSQQCDQIMEIQSWKLNEHQTKSTQTEDGRLEQSQQLQEEENVNIEELQFVIEDLTKRNTDIKTKLYHQEQEILGLTNAIEKLKDANKTLQEDYIRLQDETTTNWRENTRLLVEDNNIDLTLDDIAKLGERNNALMYENQMLRQGAAEYQRRIEEKEIAETELKKQLLNMENKLQHRQQVFGRSSSESMVLIDDAMKFGKTPQNETESEQQDESDATAFDSKNATVDELFEVKFLLESNTQYFEEDESQHINSSMNSSDDDEDEGDEEEKNLFQRCIQEGELASEMEEVFRKFSESSILDGGIDEPVSSSKDEIIMDDRNPELIPGEMQPKQMQKEAKPNNQCLQTKCDELQKLVEKLRDEIKGLDQQLQDSEQNVLTCTISLKDRSEEVLHHLQRIKDLEKVEESLCIEIENLDACIKEKSIQLTESTSSIEEYKYKVDTLKKECDGYKAIIDEQENMLSAIHDQSTLMQRNFNDLYIENNHNNNIIEEQSKQLQQTINELEAKTHQLENSIRQRDSLSKDYLDLKNDFDKLSALKISLENEVTEYEHQFLQLEDGLDSKLKHDNELNQELKNLDEKNAEKERIIAELKAQLRDYEDIISAHEQRNAQMETTTPLTGVVVVDGDGDPDRSQNISFEIQQASYESSKTATEVSIDNGDITLPEIHIMKVTDEHLTTALCARCLQRCDSQQSVTSFNSNSLLPNKYMKSSSLGALSEVSDIESYNGDSDHEKNYSSDYVSKLKNKLKVSRNKIRDRNKVIQNQNEDLDNFLEDIRNKEIRIHQLQCKIKELENQKSTHPLFGNEKNLLSLDTPDFLDSVTNSDIVKDEMISQLIILAEECCCEIMKLQNAIEDGKTRNQISEEDYQTMNSNLQNSQENLDRLRQKLSKYRELGLISNSECYEDEPMDVIFLGSPSAKTVNEIRRENEELIAQNVDLRVEIEELKQKLDKSRPQLNSSLTIDLPPQGGQVDVTNDDAVLTPYLRHQNQTTNDDRETSSTSAGENEMFGNIATLSHTETTAFTNVNNEERTDDGTLHRSQSTSNDVNISESEPYGGADGEAKSQIEELINKLSIAELQIEKDWTIINEQSNQLENLHTQFIEQRDENRESMLKLQEKNKSLEEQQQEIQHLNEKISEIQATSKGKEQELGRILIEKEDGIEKLHLMIFELEKSLSNSQVHIEGILKESMLTRENEESRDSLIKEYENKISALKEEVVRLKSESSGIIISPEVGIGLTSGDLNLVIVQEKLKNLKTTHSVLKEQVAKITDDFKSEMVKIFQQIHVLLSPSNNPELLAGVKIPDDMPDDISDDNDDLFIPKLKKRSTHFVDDSTSSTEDDVDSNRKLTWKKKYQQMEKQNENLQKSLEEKEQSLLRKDEIHTLEIDTLVQSLTKKHLDHRYHRLPMSTDLRKTDNHAGQTDFLQKCLQQVKPKQKDCEKEIQSAPEP